MLEADISKAPSAPDPYATAAAQTQTNQSTAEYNAALNRTNTVSPLGSSTYTISGTDPKTGAPMYTQTIALSPEQQQLYDAQLKQSNDITGLGNALTPQIAASFNRGITGDAASGQAAQDAYYNKETAYLDPQYKQGQSDLEAKLANQGVVQGSDAYTRAQGDQDRAKTFAYQQAQDQAITAGQDAQSRSIANQVAVNAAPLNQLASLRSGTPVSMPTFQPTYQTSTNPADISGAINNNYNQQVAASNNFNSGLFGLGAAGVTALSDRRLKTNIEYVGETGVLRLPVYDYDYIWGGPRQRGVMAQDVLEVMPAAVVQTDSGFMAVNYGLIA